MQELASRSHIAFLVQGLFEISDSIGFDCVYEYRELKKASERQHDIGSIRIFAERAVASRYPDVAIEDMDAFYAWARSNPSGLVIYHYCGEWKEIDSFLIRRETPSVVRWHNNTPPWFYMDGGEANTLHTIAGFDKIVELLASSHLRFWVNSEFTARQALALGGKAENISVVYPASRYLYKQFQDYCRQGKEAFGSNGYDLLFVGRVVRHKGYRGLFSVASRLQKATGDPVRLHLPGRIDSFFQADLAKHVPANIETFFYGEVSEADLAGLYRQADVFLCLSEHEGFGLPVFEAISCEVPVVAWATTAFEGLLASHPLAFAEYDINLFVAAILALKDETVYARVVAIQKAIGGQYSASVVNAQLDSALATVLTPSAAEHAFSASLPVALLQNTALAQSIVAAVTSGRPRIAETSVPRDSGHNLYSLYDLAIYRDILDTRTMARNALLQPPRDDPHVFFPASEFSWHKGSLANSLLTVPVTADERAHLVFGPYVALPDGCYRAEFLMRSVDDCPIKVVADAAHVGHPLAERHFTLSAAADRAGHFLDFDVGQDGAVIELRVRSTPGESGEVLFEGVKVRLAPKR